MASGKSTDRPARLHSFQMLNKKNWQTWAWASTLLLVLIFSIRTDISSVNWATELTIEGSSPPERNANSVTGYELGQRHFLGTHERGTTYRWIARAQDLIAAGPLEASPYFEDNAPEGRPKLGSRLYANWIASISWSLHFITGEPVSISVEQAALWEPVISHAIAFIVAVAFMWIRFGSTAGGITGLFFAFFPPISGQFLPGVLTSETSALLFASYAIALILQIPTDRNKTAKGIFEFPIQMAIATAISVWLDPSIGFPVAVVTTIAGACAIYSQDAKIPFLKWSLVGSILVLAAWALDRSPWDIAASELRYVHPLYAIAWLGAGLALHGWQNLRTQNHRSWLNITTLAIGISLFSALVYTQIDTGYKGWLYTDASMRRLTSLDENLLFSSAADWLKHTSAVEILFISMPGIAAAILLVFKFYRHDQSKDEIPRSLLATAVVLACILLLAFFKVRWSIVVSLSTLPLIWSLYSEINPNYRRILTYAVGIFFFGLLAWRPNLPASLKNSTETQESSPSDLDALVYRHLSHWLATHNPETNISALAPQTISDSLVFHGGNRVLMSTAWESHTGQIAASRILSAPDSNEAEAVMLSREITHLILPSWDKVLPLFVRAPEEKRNETLYEQLKRWIHPPILRPVPYKLPQTPGLEDEVIAIFKVTNAQDEALSLSRLTEYFLEMEFDKPANAAVKVLADSFPSDPNAAIARAFAYRDTNDRSAFRKEVAKLANNIEQGLVPREWDRRVLRGVILAMGGKHKLARFEISACAASLTDENLFELTSLQVFQLTKIMKLYQLEFPDDRLEKLATSLCSEYLPRSAVN